MNHSPVLINPRSQGKKKEEGNEDVGGECIYGKEDEPDVMGLYLEKKKTSIITIQFRNLLRGSWQVIRSD